MAKQTKEPLFKYGDRVEVLHSNKTSARIVELRGPLGPGGMHIYRVRVKRWPKSIDTEVREDQLKLLPTNPPPDPPKKPLYNVGDRVKIKLSNGMRGRIVELRGPLGPGGMHIYRIRVKRDPKPTYIEVMEDQLVLLPPKPRPADPPATPESA